MQQPQTNKPIRISYYSDVLCIWAYIAQIRLDELTTNFQDKIEIDYHFVSIFGNAHKKLEARWRDRGGLQGYSAHVHEVAAKFDHIKVHPDIWVNVTPSSSMSCALLSKDFDLVKEHTVSVSPTLIFNEGRQRLNGNVGYRVVEANIRELLHNPPNEQSWC